MTQSSSNLSVNATLALEIASANAVHALEIVSTNATHVVGLVSSYMASFWKSSGTQQDFLNILCVPNTEVNIKIGFKFIDEKPVFYLTSSSSIIRTACREMSFTAMFEGLPEKDIINVALDASHRARMLMLDDATKIQFFMNLLALLRSYGKFALDILKDEHRSAQNASASTGLERKIIIMLQTILFDYFGKDKVIQAISLNVIQITFSAEQSYTGFFHSMMVGKTIPSDPALLAELRTKLF